MLIDIKRSKVIFSKLHFLPKLHWDNKLECLTLATLSSLGYFNTLAYWVHPNVVKKIKCCESGPNSRLFCLFLRSVHHHQLTSQTFFSTSVFLSMTQLPAPCLLVKNHLADRHLAERDVGHLVESKLINTILILSVGPPSFGQKHFAN
jgi:hypothetical protein